jgi:L-aspartate oxidase
MTWGETSIQNLYAVGRGGLHRPAWRQPPGSTSLLEGLVWGERAAEHIANCLEMEPACPYPPRGHPALGRIEPDCESDPALIQGDMQTIQNIMWHYVGLIRSGDRLSRAIRELRHLQNEIETFYRTTKLSDGLIGLRNAVEAALIIAKAARHNRQSRGCHYRTDSVKASMPTLRM